MRHFTCLLAYLLPEALAEGEREAAAAAAKAAAAAGEENAEDLPVVEEPERPAMLRLELGDNGVGVVARRRVLLLLLEAAGEAAPNASRVAVAEF